MKKLQTVLLVGLVWGLTMMLIINRPRKTTSSILMVLKTNVSHFSSNVLIQEESDITDSVKTIPSTITPQPPEPTRNRMAIICYIGGTDDEVITFLTMLYGSWRFIHEKKNQIVAGNMKMNVTSDIDIVAFCEPHTCKKIEKFCTFTRSLQSITVEHDTPRCWAVVQENIPELIKLNYPAINSYVMFNRSDISYLIPKYKYLFRTDHDVFVTPSLLTYNPPKNFMFGNGGYSVHFNIIRLENISTHLGMKYRDVNNIGSTWMGETELFIKAARKTLHLTKYLLLNEFKPNLPGLEKINLDKNSYGKWPEWWKPVSSMYAAEIALNHLIKDISFQNKEDFDKSSCSSEKILSVPHIHCWHDDCQFYKFAFLKHLKLAINSRDGLPGDVLHKIFENMYPKKNIYNMRINDYATHVAWNSASRYLRSFFVKN